MDACECVWLGAVFPNFVSISCNTKMIRHKNYLLTSGVSLQVTKNSGMMYFSNCIDVFQQRHWEKKSSEKFSITGVPVWHEKTKVFFIREFMITVSIGYYLVRKIKNETHICRNYQWFCTYYSLIFSVFCSFNSWISYNYCFL